VNCFICGQPATRRVIVSKTDPQKDLRYVCCDACEPTHIPQGDVVAIRTEPLSGDAPQ
jgi:hypothetical protein